MSGDIAAATAVIGDLYEAIGQRILTARRGRGHTQAELGKAVGLSRASIANVEAGVQRTPVHTLIAIAQALDIDPADLVGVGSELPRITPTLPAAASRLRRNLTAARDEIEALLAALPEPTDNPADQPDQPDH